VTRGWVLAAAAFALTFLTGSGAAGADTGAKQETKASTTATLCFADDNAVYLLRPGSAKPQKLFSEKQIANARISPAGDRVAYTRDISKQEEEPVRQVAIFDMATSKSRVLDSVAGTNNYGPVWSPDGSKVMFQHWTGDQWQVALANADGSKLDAKPVARKGTTSIGAAWWEPDGRKFWVYELDNFYQFDLAGNQLDESPFAAVLGDVDQASGYTFSLSYDGTQLLFEALKEVPDVDAEGYPAAVVFMRPVDEGGPAVPANVSRVSPPAMQAQCPAWLPEPGKFAFVGSGRKPGIYVGDINSTASAVLLVRGKYRDLSATR